tara:strand:- start:6583 stop:7377 length:795 start_codon:yes stop_codon:yes gene_type:complete
MIKSYNYIIHIISLILSKIFKFKEVSLYNLFIRLSIGKFKFSKYGVLLHNQSFNENTYKFCMGGAYGDEYSNYLKNYPKKFIFLDIGSNIGLYSCVASRSNFCKKIYSFEPLKFMCKVIQINFRLNAVKGKIIDAGIYSQNTKKDIFFDPNHTGVSSIIKKKNKYYKKRFKCEFINYQKLDKIFIKDKITNYLVKIDVEGVEKIVIQELIKTKNFKYVSSIWIEINNIKELSVINKMLSKRKFILVKNFKSKLTKDYLFIKNEK